MRVLSYIKARLDERSTWAGIAAAIGGGAALASPYSWLAIAAGTIAAIVPTSGDER
ncbi:MAG TPA: hypothetical protein VFW19_15045 [Allosphingosinicella sp.]|nr:hypothetical protein [Allosphingosinicella sp.]